MDKLQVDRGSEQKKKRLKISQTERRIAPKGYLVMINKRKIWHIPNSQNAQLLHITWKINCEMSGFPGHEIAFYNNHLFTPNCKPMSTLRKTRNY